MLTIRTPTRALSEPDSTPSSSRTVALHPRRRVVRVVALCALAVAAAVALLIAMHGPMKDDIAWLLYVATNWLHGSRLYVDIVEVNPPLIVWLCAVPVLIGELMHLQAGWIAMPFFAALVLGCAAWAVRIVTDRRTDFGDPIVMFAVVGAVLMLIPSIEFGQREHLLIAAALPYLAVVLREQMCDPPAARTAILAAIVAALGCALKPRYVIAFGAVEVYCLTQGMRLIRPGVVAAALTLGAYVGAVALFEPAFFSEAIPMAFALYGASDVPLLDMMFDCRLLLVGIAVGAVLVATQPARDERRRLPAVLLVFAIATTVECFIQGKSWYYHRIPATTAAVLCLIAWTSIRLRDSWRPGWRILGPSLLAGVVLVAFGLHTYERLSHEIRFAVGREKTTVARLEALIRREHAHSYVAFTDWIGLGFPVVNETKVVWASRFDSMWALDGELWRTRIDGVAPAEFPIRRWVTADFERTCPDVVVVDRRGRLDYVALLGSADPAFKAVWHQYARIAAFDGLIVFRRQPSTAVPHLPATWLKACHHAVTARIDAGGT